MKITDSEIQKIGLNKNQDILHLLFDPSKPLHNRQINNYALVLEDNPNEQSIFEYILKMIGFKSENIMSFKSGEQFIHTLCQKSLNDIPKFSFVISDIYLEGQQNGLVISELLKNNHPSLPIVISSSSSSTHVMKMLDDQTFYYPFLEKPFSISYAIDFMKKILKNAQGTPHGK